jgi:hypothetical protein
MCVGFVSTLHSITFFELANTMWMAVLLGITYEVGQASVLFSILMTKNSQKILPWALMILLTGLQITANVYASFKFMDLSGSIDWTFWQRSILFWMETDDPEMFKVVISWITGALLPIVALGMTSLVAENLKLKDEEQEAKENNPEFDDQGNIKGAKVYDEPAQLNDVEMDEDPEPNWTVVDEDQRIEEIPNNEADFIAQEVNSKFPEEVKGEDPSIVTGKIDVIPPNNEIYTVKAPPKTEQLHNFAEALLDPKNQLKFPAGAKTPGTPGEVEVIKKQMEINLQPDEIGVDPDDWRKMAQPIKNWEDEVDLGGELKPETIINTDSNTGLFPKKPINNQRGWHLKREFIDENGDVYHYGQYQEGSKAISPVPKKP